MQCKATNRAGNRCGRGAIEGGTVCVMHGGAAPHVKRAAAERIAALVDPAIRRIEITIANDKRPDLALIASRDILDRTGHKAKDQIELSNPEGSEFNLRVLSDAQLESFTALFAAISDQSRSAQAIEEPD